MASKNISIDLEAYKRLKHWKKENESFSDVIKRLIQEPFDYEKWFKKLEAHPMSDQARAAVEKVISDRRAPQNMRGYDAVSRHDRFDRSGSIKKKSVSRKSAKRPAA